MTAPANVRAVRWFRLLASTMNAAADDLGDTPHALPLQTSAGELEEYANELDPPTAPVLHLVTTGVTA